MGDRLFKISNNWNSLQNDKKALNPILIKWILLLLFSINKAIKKFINYMLSSNQNQLKDTYDVHCIKLPYIGNLKYYMKKKSLKLCKEVCKEKFYIRLVFTSFKIKSYFCFKNTNPDDFKSFLLYKLTCDSCSSSYIGQTCRHFKTRIGNISKRITSLIFLNLCNLP